MSLKLERWYPFVIACVAGIVWWILKLPLPKSIKEFLSAAISLGAILTGFIATSQAILAALPTDAVMVRLRASGYIGDLIFYVATALYGCLIFSVYSIAGFFWDDNLPFWYGAIWISLAAFSVSCFYRLSKIFFKILGRQPVA
ncbi:hypothetical protein HF909_07830 [Ralstonia pseudosolanacearum]|uniref:Uncharacterized protein n=1 Tax=Ralstonia solanacearum TaxID=305 RepID=A0AA92K0Q1_RALSL|nr:hypothetical protein [Ralstonia pseudosolanacearum]QOK96351.1 hypothetical protein HF909_07830 [Ralstonia pseudosolanacearum]